MYPRSLIAMAMVLLAGARGCWSAPPDFRHSYALVIGVDDYSKPWDPLHHAHSDAQEVGKVLKGLGFQLQELYDKDATKRNILARFAALAKTVSADDRFLVYFAGHGHTTTDARGDHGFIVPWGGTLDTDTLISMDELQTAAATFNIARHQLFIMDSCYSGILTQGASLPPRDTTIEQRATRPARQIITAGSKGQEVVDAGSTGHSLFTAALLDGLKGRADLNGDGFITASELIMFLRLCASTPQQSPELGHFPGQDGGDFYFKTPSGAMAPADIEYIRSCTERSAPRTVQPCDSNGDGVVNADDVQVLVNQALGFTACKNDLTGNRKCTVVDVQRIVNASLGQHCRVGR
jgi:hypothetical protein